MHRNNKTKKRTRAMKLYSPRVCISILSTSSTTTASAGGHKTDAQFLGIYFPFILAETDVQTDCIQIRT